MTILTLSIIVCIVFGLFYYINYPQYTKTIWVDDFYPYVDLFTFGITDQDGYGYLANDGLIFDLDVINENVITYHIDPFSHKRVINTIKSTSTVYDYAGELEITPEPTPTIILTANLPPDLKYSAGGTGINWQQTPKNITYGEWDYPMGVGGKPTGVPDNSTFTQEGDHWIKTVDNYTILMWNATPNSTSWTYSGGINGKPIITDQTPLPRCSDIQMLRVGTSCTNGDNYPIVTCRQEDLEQPTRNLLGDLCLLARAGQMDTVKYYPTSPPEPAPTLMDNLSLKSLGGITGSLASVWDQNLKEYKVVMFLDEDNDNKTKINWEGGGGEMQ